MKMVKQMMSAAPPWAQQWTVISGELSFELGRPKYCLSKTTQQSGKNVFDINILQEHQAVKVCEQT